MLIKDEALKKALLRALGEEEAAKVLSAINDESKSVKELIDTCNIPHTSAYRLLKELRRAGLVDVERIVVTADGAKYSLYRSTFREVSIKIRGGETIVEATPNRSMFAKAYALFDKVGGASD